MSDREGPETEVDAEAGARSSAASAGGGGAEQPKKWKEALTRAVQTIQAERRNSATKRFESLADVVQAMAAFDRNGRIQLEFADDDEQYDISGLQQHAKKREEQTLTHVRQSSKLSYNVPTLTICIMIVGTHGDVQPFVAIAKRLQLDGHRVRLATHAVYREFVMSHGVEFYPLGGDPKELAAYMVKTGGHLIPVKLETIQKDVPRNLLMIEEILRSTWPAVSEADPDGGGPGIPGKPFQAQAIISNPVTYGHIHVAEKLGIPLHIMFPQPWVPTVEFPHPLANMPYTGKPKKTNYMSYKLVDLLMWQGTEGIVNDFRMEVLGLSKIRKGDGGRDILLDLAIPHAFMWSPRLVPKPADWGKIYDVIGTVTLEGPGSTYTPSPELEAFLDHDEGPIFVGFGSMMLEDPLGTTQMIIEAAEQAGVRVLIQSSWSDMAGNLTVPENIFFLGSCPHDWLMPRMSAVVHHGGAGTTAAGLLAGKPTFIVPFFGDQPFWGHAVMEAGVGVEPCPIAQLTTEKLRVAFEGLKSPQLRTRATVIRDLMCQEDGAGAAVDAFYRNLPLRHMRCDLNCGRVATLWSQKDKLRLCDQCEFVVTSRPENSPTDIVDYHFVDYSARGPDNLLEGASAGVGALVHEFGSDVMDVFIKPAQGYREEEAKGAVIGLVKGLGGLIISPIQGAILFADHVATGHYNSTRGGDQRKKGSVLSENKKLFDAIGLKPRPNVHTGSMNPDELLDVDSSSVDQVSVLLSSEEKKTLEDRFNALMQERKVLHHKQPFKLVKGSSVSLMPPKGSQGGETVVASSTTHDGNGSLDLSKADVHRPEKIDHEENIQQQCLKSLSSKAIPKMNICMMTTGSWEESVQQYVAIGLRLKADGHCVRIATNSGLRDRIVSAGLDFYPLGGRAATTGKFLQYLYERIQDEKKHKSRLLNFAKSKLNSWRDVFPDMDDLRELVFSLWPACVKADPLTPGDAFRADVIISHPYLFGQAIVAERLGVPLHCMSYNPQSRTQAFPHIINTNLKLQKPYHYEPTNAVSYDVITRAVWAGMRDILDEFRYFLGLTGKSVATNLLEEWGIPHTYLWNSTLLPKPSDWGSEITIAGYVELEENDEQDEELAAIDHELQRFATTQPNTPIIYFGFLCSDWDPQRVQDLVGSIEKAAREAGVRVVFQAYEDSEDETSFPVGDTDMVFEIGQRFHVKHILRHVHAAVHWGDLSITSTCLAAAKPACVVPRNITQRLWGQSLVLAGAGVEPLEIDALTPANLVHVFRTLLEPKLAHCAKRVAPTFSSSKAIETAVSVFYNNLPLEGMTCDLDPERIARVYDSVHELKLSYEARLVIHQLTGDEGSGGDLKYKPLQYSVRHPPRFSLRDLDTKLFSTTSVGSPKTQVPKVHPTGEKLADQAGVEMKRRRHQLSRMQSMALNVVEVPKFWDSPEEQAECSKKINANYEKTMMAHRLEKGSTPSRSASVCT